MAKRFTDSNKWDDPWYLDLSVEHKLAWEFICNKCDAVGVWKPSARLLEFNTGVKDLDGFLAACGPERIFVMPNGNWWIVKFCDFQYGALSEGAKSPAIQHYVKLLKKHTLWEGYIKGIDTLKEKEKEKEKDKDKDKEDGVEETKEPEPLSDDWFAGIFDELTLEQIAMAHSEHDIPDQLEKFKSKVRGSPDMYRHRDAGGIRMAFSHQLRNTKPTKRRLSTFHREQLDEFKNLKI